MAQPLCEDDFPSKQDMESYQKDLEANLKKVRHVLEWMDHQFKQDKLFREHLLPNITLDDVLIHADLAKTLKAASSRPRTGQAWLPRPLWKRPS